MEFVHEPEKPAVESWLTVKAALIKLSCASLALPSAWHYVSVGADG